MSFNVRLESLRKEKKSGLCVGLDPALPKQRNNMTIPEKYINIGDENQARLNFCLDIVDAVKDCSVAIKPNQQYIFGFTKNQHQTLTSYIQKCGMVSILDYKLNDIGDTVQSAIFHIAASGYDGVTFNPLPGNLQKTVYIAHVTARRLRGSELGIIVLTLMSNPEAATYMKEARINNSPLFEFIAEQVRDFKADGCVVGATGHVSINNIQTIREIVGPNKVFLVPGIGAQGGNLRKIFEAAGENVLINVGRDIIYSVNPQKKAEEYLEKLRKLTG